MTRVRTRTELCPTSAPEPRPPRGASSCLRRWRRVTVAKTPLPPGARRPGHEAGEAAQVTAPLPSTSPSTEGIFRGADPKNDSLR